MEKWLYYAGFIVFVILFYTGLIHIFNRIRISKEMNKKHLSVTSSSNGQFKMKVKSFGFWLLHKKLKGLYKGDLPKHDDFIYLVKDSKYIVVKVLWAKKLQYDNESNCFECEIAVWGAKKDFMDCIATNVRPEKTIEVKKEVLATKANYPIVIKATYRNYMIAIINVFMGIVFMIVTIQSYMLSSIIWQIILFVLLAILFFVFGVVLLIETTNYSLTMEADGVISIKKFGKVKQYSKDDYFYKAVVQRGQSKETYLLTIYSALNNVALANVDDRDEQFYNLYAALKQQKPKR